MNLPVTFSADLKLPLRYALASVFTFAVALGAANGEPALVVSTDAGARNSWNVLHPYRAISGPGSPIQ